MSAEWSERHENSRVICGAALQGNFTERSVEWQRQKLTSHFRSGNTKLLERLSSPESNKQSTKLKKLTRAICGAA